VIQNRIPPIDDSKKTVTALVQERVRQAILSGFLAAGSRIDQNQLASDLNVSLVPVREALKILEGEGFVQIIPRRGAFVTETSIADMEDLYFARQILEGQAAYHAAEKLTAADLEKLHELYDAMNHTLQTTDYAEFMALNRTFHFIIYDAAGSGYLSNMIHGLWDLAERYRYHYLLLRDQASAIQSEHQIILEASRQHDARALRNAIIQHMQHTLTSLRENVAANKKRES
jgi:DNA-binding GntR family transcriptional regulator